MKCPNCGAEVEKGSLFCPKCLEEVPWVAEYSTIETLSQKNKLNKTKPIKKMKKQLAKRKLSKKRRQAVFFASLIILLLLLSGMAIFYFNYRNDHSYTYQYKAAQKQYENRSYDKALTYIDRAITLSASHAQAYQLMARILDSSGDTKGAIKVMETTLPKFPDSLLIYTELISLYEESGKSESIKNLLLKCKNVKIKNEFSEYLAGDPEISEPTGTYVEELLITIEGTDEEFYYTLDGSTPTKESKHYRKPFKIKEGTTELKVIGYNSHDIPSDVIYRKYIVSFKIPDAPVILPDEEYFEKDTMITVSVPDGCICYYAFDEIPTTVSTRYTGPIAMPEGEHTLYAILIGANGTSSEVSSKTYQLIY